MLRRTSSCSALLQNGPEGVRDAAKAEWLCRRNNNNEDDDNNGAASEARSAIIILEPLSEGVEHISQLLAGGGGCGGNKDRDLCHFCSVENSDPVHEDCTRLKIVSRGTLRAHKEREGGTNGRSKLGNLSSLRRLLQREAQREGRSLKMVNYGQVQTEPRERGGEA